MADLARSMVFLAGRPEVHIVTFDERGKEDVRPVPLSPDEAMVLEELMQLFFNRLPD